MLASASARFPSAISAYSMKLDHLVGDRKHTRRNAQGAGLGGLEVDHQLVLGCSLHRQIGRLLILEDAVDIASRAAEQVERKSPCPTKS
jgi:hypothetical protein